MVPAKEKHNEGNKEPLRAVVQGHFRALVSQLVQGEGVQGEANQFNKKPVKTLMFFEGCPRRFRCTFLLKGACVEELKKIKHVVQYCIFAIICSAAFNANFDAPTYKVNALASTVPQADYLWRIIVMVGAIPATLTYYWRMKMPETARYTALVAKNAKQAASDMSKVLQVEIEAESQKAEPTANAFALFPKEFMHRHGQDDFETHQYNFFYY
ncbi:hypothetical protein PS1_036215 [Malus domestica]